MYEQEEWLGIKMRFLFGQNLSLKMVRFVRAIENRIGRRPQMSKWVSIIVTVLLAFLFGAFTSKAEANLFESHSPQQIAFQPVQVSSGKKANGAEFSTGLYDSPDGNTVSSTVETYVSAAYAKREMKNRIKQATKIIERGCKRNQSGKTVGERIVIYLPDKARSLEYANVLWLDGENLHIIESSSLEHALDFERQFYK